MPSEYSPWWSRPRMTQAQIRKLQREQEEARKIAEQKLRDAKQTDEWKKEQALLKKMEQKLENGTIVDAPVWPWEHIIEEEAEDIPLTFWEEIKLFFKDLWKKISDFFKKFFS